MTALLLTYRPGDTLYEWSFCADPGVHMLQVPDPEIRHALIRAFCQLLEAPLEGLDCTASERCPGILAISNPSGGEHRAVLCPQEGFPAIPASFACIDPTDFPDFLPPGAIGSLGNEDCRRIGNALRTFSETGRMGMGLKEILGNLERHMEVLRTETEPGAEGRDTADRLERLKEERRNVLSAKAQVRELGESLGVHRDRASTVYTEMVHAKAALHIGVARAAAALQTAIGELDGKLSAIGFPQLSSDTLAEIQRAENVTETARRQCERTETELEKLEVELASLASADHGPATGACLPERTQRETRQCLVHITELKARLDEIATQMEAVNDQICAVQRSLSELPDFSRVAPDPVDWLTQLARSFKTALNARTTDADERDSLRTRMAEMRAELAADEELFRESAAFAEQLQAHEELKRHWKMRTGEVTERQQCLRSELAELQDERPGYILLTLGCALFLCLLFGVYIGYRNPPVLYSIAMISVALVYFTTCLFQSSRKISSLQQSIAASQEELDALNAEEAGQVTGVDLLLQRSGAKSARELEARYDHYRNLKVQFHVLENRLRQQERHAQESRERIPMLLERVGAKLRKVDESPADESDVENAALRAIAKYQRYREIKRRIADLRNQHQAIITRRRYLGKDLAAERERLPELEKELRATMRQGGFTSEADISDIDEAISGYGHFIDSTKSALGRREWLQQTIDALRHRFVLEKDEYERQRMAFSQVLEEKGFRSAREARELAAKAGERHRLSEERDALALRLEQILQGRTLESMHRLWLESMAILEKSAPEEGGDVDFLQAHLQQAEMAWETAMEAYREAHGEYRRLVCSMRPLHEIEEEVVALTDRSNALIRERDAAATATVLVEEALHAGHEKLAGMLALRAEGILAAMGHAACVEVDLQEESRIYIVTQPAGTGVTGEISVATCWFALRLAAADLLVSEHWPILVLGGEHGQEANSDWTVDSFLAALGELGPSRRVLLLAEGDAYREAAGRRGIPVTRVELP